MQIFGVGGTNGSGKDTVAAMLAERHGFLNASATEMFLGELKKRGWPVDREHKAKLSAEWRREFGMGVIVDKAVEMFNKEQGKYKGLVVGSLRHRGKQIAYTNWVANRFGLMPTRKLGMPEFKVTYMNELGLIQKKVRHLNSS